VLQIQEPNRLRTICSTLEFSAVRCHVIWSDGDEAGKQMGKVFLIVLAIGIAALIVSRRS